MLSKLFDWITPLTLMAVAGVLMIGTGIVHSGEQNNILQYLFGIPLLGGALIAHFLIRRVLNRNTLHIWLLEFVLVATFLFAFYYVW